MAGEGVGPTPVIRLELFGGPALWRHMKPVKISPLQSGLLAAAFAQRARQVSRRTIQRLLWDTPDARAVRHRLSQLVYQTNQLVEVRIMRLSGEHVRVHRDRVESDLDEYDAMVRAGDFRSAMDLLKRGFLAATAHRKTPAFADWIEEQRLATRSILRRAALSDWEAAERVLDWNRARRAAEVLLWLAPGEEMILRRVMRARVMAGQVREAEAAYWAFAERADPSGKWTPEAATRRLLHNVKRAGDPANRPAGPAGLSREPPLVGRSRELAALAAHLYEKRPGGGWKTIAVLGDTGVGKTRLVREATRSARFRGCRVIEAAPCRLERAIALTPLLEPLGRPWVLPFLERLIEPWRSTMFALIPEFGSGDGSPDGAAPIFALPHAPTHASGLSLHACEAFLRLFAEIAKTQKTILVLDALHWVDDASISVLQFLRRRWRRGDMTLLATYSEEELRPGTNVHRFIEEEATNPDNLAMRLPELDEARATELARHVIEAVSLARGDPQERKAARSRKDARAPARLSPAEIARAAGGNPRFVIELAASLHGGSPSGSGGAQPRAGARVLQVPAPVQRLVARRLARIGKNARKVAFALAVLGRETLNEALRSVAGVSSAQCLDALDRLHRARLVHWTPSGVRFLHALYADAVYDQIHPSRRTMLHGRTAEMQHRAAKAPEPLELARHYHLAGKQEHASMCAIEAVRKAESLGMAERLEVQKVAHELSAGPRRVRIAARLAQSCYDMRLLGSAIRHSAEALEAPSISGIEKVDAGLIAAGARHRAGLADTDSTLAELASIAAQAGALADRVRRARVVDARVQALLRADRLEEAAAEASRLRSRADAGAVKSDGSDLEVRCRTLATLALAPERMGPQAALAVATEAVRLAGGAGALAALARQREVGALAACGLLATPRGWDAQAAARKTTLEAGKLGWHAEVLVDLVLWHTLAGDFRVGARVLTELLRATHDMDCPDVRRRVRLARCELAVASGDLKEARQVLDAVSAAEDAGTGSGRLACRFAALEGILLLESGKLQPTERIARSCPVPEHLERAPLALIMFHVRRLSRTNDLVLARKLLERAMEANEASRAAVWIKLALEFVRLARRTETPRPEMAARAQGRATELDLSGLAHRFLPYCAP